MASQTVFVMATFALRFYFASTLEMKRFTRITLDNSNKDTCSACEADAKASWAVKCTYATSCGLCPACSQGDAEDDQVVSSEEKAEKEDKGDAAAKQDSHSEDEIHTKLCSVCEADMSASWEVKCTYKTCGLCTVCDSDKTEDEQIEHFGEAAEKDDKADVAVDDLPAPSAPLTDDAPQKTTQCQGSDGKMYDHDTGYNCKWHCVNGEWEHSDACAQCQGSDGKMYNHGAVFRWKWQCANGKWENAEKDEEETPEKEATTLIALSTHAEDSSNKDTCSACEADAKVSWAVKCTYATSCGLCPVCSQDKTEDEQVPSSEEKAEKDVKGNELAKQDSHNEDEIHTTLCSVCEADVSASWDVKCTYKTCGLCTVCNSDKTEDENVKYSEEKTEKDDKADDLVDGVPSAAATLTDVAPQKTTQCQGSDGKMYDHGTGYNCKWQCVNGEWEHRDACAQCQGSDGKMYNHGAVFRWKWQCANGKWENAEKDEEETPEKED